MYDAPLIESSLSSHSKMKLVSSLHLRMNDLEFPDSTYTIPLVTIHHAPYNTQNTTR